jgi:uncharacterized protein (DUF1015 family)
MATVLPFRGVRADDALAGEIIAPPYDVLDRAEARQILARLPRSFLQVTRADATLPDAVDEHAPEVYAAARAQLEAMLAEGALQQDPTPCYYLYSQRWRGRLQVGLMGVAPVADYDAGRIKRHELTRPDKEQDRVDHIEATDCQTGLVFLASRTSGAGGEGFAAALEGLHAALPLAWRTTTDDGVEHGLQVVSDPAQVAALGQALSALPALYVADGHHRSAAASRVCAARGGRGGSDHFLVGVFPDHHLQVLPYNRLVADLAGLSADAFLHALRAVYTVEPGVGPEPRARGELCLYLGGAWYGLRPLPGVVPADPVGRLDVAVLQDRVLSPVLGIHNPRTDSRIRFVGGIRGPAALVAAVDGGRAAAAFCMFPTGLDQLFDVADAGELMPPKSTWFEPKLRGGVVAHRLG